MMLGKNKFVMLFGCLSLLLLSSWGQSEEVAEELIQYYNGDRPKLEAKNKLKQWMIVKVI